MLTDDFDEWTMFHLKGVMGRAAKEYAAYTSIPTRIPSAGSILREIEGIAAARWQARRWGAAPLYEVVGLPLPVDSGDRGIIRMFNPMHYRRIIEQYLVQHEAMGTSYLDDVQYEAFADRPIPLVLCLEVRILDTLLGKINADHVMTILIEQISLAVCKYLHINRASIAAPRIRWSYQHGHCGVDVALVEWDEGVEVAA